MTETPYAAWLVQLQNERIPYQRTGRLQRERQASREAKYQAELKAARKPRRKAHKPIYQETYEDRLDDLGESPDF